MEEDIEIIEELIARTKQQMANTIPFIVWLAMEPRSAIQVEMYFWLREKFAESYLHLLKRRIELLT